MRYRLEVRVDEAVTRHLALWGLVGYAPAPARIRAVRPFGGVFVIAFACIHAQRSPEHLLEFPSCQRITVLRDGMTRRWLRAASRATNS